MNDDKVLGVAIGLLFGMVITILLLVALERTPNDERRRVYQEVVNNGHASWVATTNGEVNFIWRVDGCQNTNNVVNK